MSEATATVDFGAPEKFGAHVFRVEIPATRTEPVVIVEDCGYRGHEAGYHVDEERVILSRRVWSAISDIAGREFNDRLKAEGSSPVAGTPAQIWWSDCSSITSSPNASLGHRYSTSTRFLHSGQRNESRSPPKLHGVAV
jgi:hypothetical protein